MYSGVDQVAEELRNHLPYDTSMFEGSSGSPIFDKDGYVIAMHTQGLAAVDGGKRIMEFGVTFKAIFEDIRQLKGADIAAELFPEYSPFEFSAMDVD